MSPDPKATRPFIAVEPLLQDALYSIAGDALSKILDEDILPVPSQLGQVCMICGCSEEDACTTDSANCSWATPNLCSACASTTHTTHTDD
ncbi:hypothetical protein [Beijerinckia indica]|uniref:Uncharacterized protein n=1 Tax=Beijerinckia indica subsp. indica (strain ATCC 9039 / DSM 1715 / NCIMB 8712) TaxID=395963 RepID=B2IL92_BEII9|nr:hypothetical protein [Beijerinckia indica]ACB97292.1 hypothetical protein Bind_3741 [Beijerinckia indica subsp. indica ATCC 9039]